MLDVNFIRQNPEKIKEGTKKKGYDPKIVERVLKVDEARRQLIAEVEKWRQARNKLKKGEIEKGRKIKEILRRLEPDLRAVEKEFKDLLYQIPNMPADDVPEGKDESENVVVRKWKEPPEFEFEVRDNLQLGENLGVIDVKRAAKVSGPRFGYLKNEAVLLEFALVRYAFDSLLKKKFIPVIPPVMIKEKVEKGLGYMEYGGRDDMYVLEKDKLVLVATAEHSLVSMHKDEIFEEKDLPRRYIGFSTCFRREAGAYGKDTRGIFRVHQFDKVEMVSFTLPEESDKEHEYLVSLEEELMKGLGLSYRVVKMCTGDLGIPAAKKYDIEAWFPAQGKYRETHSCSNCTDFQARRLNIRVRRKDKKEFVHILNGTVFSQRPILAILENYQQKDGSVLVPKILQKYVGFKKIVPKK